MTIIEGTSLCANNVSIITGVCVSIKTSLIFCTWSFSIKNSNTVVSGVGSHGAAANYVDIQNKCTVDHRGIPFQLNVW